MTPKQPDYMYVWEYRVREDSIERFEQAYGPDGDWAELFRRATGYIRTELHRDLADAQRYLTIDYWDSEESCLAFRDAFAEEFKSLDERCEALTLEEKIIGSFTAVS